VAFHLGEALEKLNDITGARDALEASLKSLPGQYQARLLLGEVYLALKNPVAAEDQFEAGLLLEPKSVEAQVGIAKAQIAERNFAGAARQLLPLSKSQSASAEVFELLAQAYSGLGKAAEARQAEARAKALKK
jgi:predicted Zn-dependent protease